MNASTGWGIDCFLAQVDQVGDWLGLNVPPIVDIAALRALPEHSLGRSLVEFLDAQHLKPLTTGPRRKQLHDAIHVLTGYGSDPIGEAEVQAFLLGAKFHMAQVVLGLGTLRLIHRHVPATQRQSLRQRLQQAFRRGQRSAFDIDRWQPQHQWHLPLTQVQTEFHL